MPAYGIFARHVRDLELANIHLNFQAEDFRPAASFADIAGCSRVSYGTSPGNLNSFTDAPAVVTEHEVRLGGLQPNTKYFYAVGTRDRILAGGDTNHFFVTPPLVGERKSTRIWVIGDSGTANANQINVRNAYERFTGARHTDLWLMLGDNAYNNGTDSEYQAAVFNVYSNLLRKSVLWSTLGNHETAQATAFTDNYPYFNIFTFPKNGEAGGMPSGTEHYYSFDYANIHFICLDSMTASRSPNGAMAGWLRADLANVTADWIIAFWHHPPYTRGSHNSDTETELIQMRTTFLPILEAHGVDLVLASHSHSYERSYLLNGHYGSATTITATNRLNAGDGRESGHGAYQKPAGGPAANKGKGAVYAVVGSSGQISGGALNHPAMFVSLNQLGSLVLDISGNRLDGKFLRENGTTNDFFTILKPNEPPLPPELISPVAGDTEVLLPPQLEVRVADPETNELTVTFSGRVAQPSQPDFTLVALPDTQYYVSSLNGGSPAILNSQVDWILNNRSTRNIAYVAQLGDCVENGDNFGDAVEWRHATNALYRLKTSATLLPEGTAYGVAVGNHDQSPLGAATGSTDFYNQYFGVDHFLPRGYYGGHFGTNNDNHFDLFEAGGMKFIVLYFEYDQLTLDTNAPVFQWANGILNTHRDRRAIVVSHYLMNPGINAAFSPQGQAVYSALKGQTNLFLMLCGHVNPPEGRRSDTFNGNTIWTAQSDYQGLTNGGNGWLRLYEFSPRNNRIQVRKFSPWLNQFEFVNTSQFDIPYQMASLEPFRVIGSFTGVRSGDRVSVSWTNLLIGTEYEWQVTVSDGTNTVRSPQWRFVTTTNSPPFASN